MSKRKRSFVVIGGLACAVTLLVASNAAAGLYVTSSAHGDAANGVQRSSMTGYNAGNCGHCHEQHAMVGGAEPAPQSGAPSKHTLFYDNNVDQTDNVCFKCHDNTAAVSQRAIINRSYSYRAGGWSGDSVSSIFSSFSSTSSHSLADILTNINGSWGYSSADSTPCAACHNPHAAQGDPFNSPNSGKSSAARGSVVSLPSLHSRDNNAWGLWGDAASELMNNYTANYQAPYYFYAGAPTVYEPAGDAVQNGSNLTDFVTFCDDCHGGTVTSGDAIFITPLNGGASGTVAAIDWTGTGDKHGQANADVLDILLPYVGTGHVLSCMDCHESHGSPNNYLIRKEVNGQVLTGTIAGNTADFGFLCQECHTDDPNVSPAHTTQGYAGPQVNAWDYVHHSSPDAPYDASASACNVAGCHSTDPGPPYTAITCTYCHFHGSSVPNGALAPAATFGTANRTTF